MRPISLTIDGINSFASSQTIDFKTLSEKGIFGIFGQTGSGKSTILDCIFLSLFGKVLRAKNALEFVNLQRSDASVQMLFECTIASKRRNFKTVRNFKVNREKAQEKADAKIFEILESGQEVLLASGVFETNQKCEEIIGFGAEEFKRCIALPQGEYSKLLKDSGYEKIQILSKIFNIEKYGSKLFDKINKKIEKEEQNLAYIKGAINEIVKDSSFDAKFSKKELETLKLQEEICAKKYAKVKKELLEKQRQDIVLEEEKKLRQELDLLLKDDQTYTKKSQQLKTLKVSLQVVPDIAKMESLANELKNLSEKIGEVDLDLDNHAKEISLFKQSYLKEKTKKTLELSQIELQRKLVQEGVLAKSKIKKIDAKLLTLSEKLKAEEEEKQKRKTNNIEATEALNLAIKKLESLRKALALEQNINKKYVIEGVKTEQTVLESLQRNSISKEKVLNVKKDKLASKIKELSAEIENIEKDTEVAKQNLVEVYGSLAGVEECLAKCTSDFVELKNAAHQYKILLEKQKKITGQIAEFGGALLDAENEQDAFVEKIAQTSDELERLNEKLEQVIYNREKYFGQNLINFIKNEQEAGAQCPICEQIITQRPHHEESVSLNKFDFDIQSLNHRILEARQLKESLIAQKAQTRQNILFIKAEIKRLKEENSKTQNSIILIEKDFPSFKGSSPSKIEKLVEISNSAKDNLANLVHTILDAQNLSAVKKTQLEKLKQEFEDIENFVYEEQKEREIVERILAEHNIEILDYSKEENKNDLDFNEILMQLIANLTEKEKISLDYIDQCGRVDSLTYQIELLREEKQEFEKKVQAVKTSRDFKDELKYLNEKEYEIKYQISKQEDLIDTLVKEEGKAKLKKANLLENYTFKQNELGTLKLGIEKILKQNSIKFADIVKDAQVEEVNLLEHEIESYKNRKKDIEDRLAHISSLFEGRSYRNVTTADLEEALDVIFKEQVETSKKIEQLKEKISITQRLKLKAKELEIQQSQVNLNLASLKELARAIQGGKLLKFITEEYLLNITEKANETFGLLTNGRYQFVFDDNFVVCDNLSGGSFRSVGTLSGGETFLASISLAIAITEFTAMMQERSLEFIFLDEGFGTLDKESLEMVMIALRRLRTSNFVVGIISHEEVVKNKIARKIEIEKANNFEGSKVKMIL